MTIRQNSEKQVDIFTTLKREHSRIKRNQYDRVNNKYPFYLLRLVGSANLLFLIKYSRWLLVRRVVIDKVQ